MQTKFLVTRSFVQKVILPFLFCSISFFYSIAQQNIVLVIADDVSPDYFGCFSTTTDTAITPNIRALADRGVRFTKVWAAPICSPTRAGIFTGRYPFRTGVGQVITSATSPQLDTNEISIAKLLHDVAPQKYNTACVGKWHLHNNAAPKRLNPNKMGFDYYSGNFNGAIQNYYAYPIIENGIQDSSYTYATTKTINDAVNWLDTCNTSKPFFLWVAFNAPHSPFHLPPASLCDTAGLTGTTIHINNNPTLYFKAAIQAMDTEFGRLLSYLQTNNLLDSTNIIFIGDNGNENEVAQIVNPTKAKATLYNYGIHIPMIAAGPAVMNKPRVSDALLNTPDLFATIAELAGFTNWKTSIPVSTFIDSKSFLPLLNNTATQTRSWIFTEQFNNPSKPVDGKTIRNEEYHLIRFDNNTEAFYHTSIDPEENTNLLLNTMTATQQSNYIFLCDSLQVLLGLAPCNPLLLTPISFSSSIEIYPNPSMHSFSIRTNKPIALWRLFSSFGDELANGNNTLIATSNYADGVYVVHIELQDGSRVVKQLLLRH